MLVSINEPDVLIRLAKPHYESTVNEMTTPGVWEYVNTNATLRDGDHVYYWISVGMGDVEITRSEPWDRIFVVRQIDGKLVAFQENI